MSNFASELSKSSVVKQRDTSEPLWTGPSGDGPQGGVTQGMIGRFLSCRERFRVYYVLGLRPAEKFNPRLEFGNMWHACEESHAAGYAPGNTWRTALIDLCKELALKYPSDREAIAHWHDVTTELFPRYQEHWSRHPDVEARTPLLQEQVFDVPYRLPSGRVVRLRGRWDSVDLVGKGKSAAIWLQENKTKSSIDKLKIERQLKFDLQTMLYVVALSWNNEHDDNGRGLRNGKFTFGGPITGVRYNVVRRSAHKTTVSMLKKFEEDRSSGRVDEWFCRWNVPIGAEDVAKFRRETLDPVLEQMCDWWEWVKKSKNVFSPNDGCETDDGERPIHSDVHWRTPFGMYNPLEEGGSGDVDSFLESGSEVGLRRAEHVFPELVD